MRLSQQASAEIVRKDDRRPPANAYTQDRQDFGTDARLSSLAALEARLVASVTGCLLFSELDSRVMDTLPKPRPCGAG